MFCSCQGNLGIVGLNRIVPRGIYIIDQGMNRVRHILSIDCSFSKRDNVQDKKSRYLSLNSKTNGIICIRCRFHYESIINNSFDKVYK